MYLYVLHWSIWHASFLRLRELMFLVIIIIISFPVSQIEGQLHSYETTYKAWNLIQNIEPLANE